MCETFSFEKKSELNNKVLSLLHCNFCFTELIYRWLIDGSDLYLPFAFSSVMCLYNLAFRFHSFDRSLSALNFLVLGFELLSAKSACHDLKF